MHISHLSMLNEARRERRAVVMLTDLTNGEQSLLEAAEIGSHPYGEVLSKRVHSGKSGLEVFDDQQVFVQVQVPAPRLVIIGAVHISQALAPMAQACGIDVTLIDPRTAFATQERFEGQKLLAQWPQDVLDEIRLDPFTALVAVTHHPKIDDVPLIAALKAQCFYVGALGSRKTHSRRVERLEAAGLDRYSIDRICAPIGMDIGAANPAEIAVAVLAQLIEALRKPSDPAETARP